MSVFGVRKCTDEFYRICFNAYVKVNDELSVGRDDVCERGAGGVRNVRA